MKIVIKLKENMNKNKIYCIKSILNSIDYRMFFQLFRIMYIINTIAIQISSLIFQNFFILLISTFIIAFNMYYLIEIVFHHFSICIKLKVKCHHFFQCVYMLPSEKVVYYFLQSTEKAMNRKRAFIR